MKDFRKGDKIKCIYIAGWDDDNIITLNKIYTVKNYMNSEVCIKNNQGIFGWYYDYRFEKYIDFKQKIKFVKELIK